ILKKFDFISVKTASTPIETKKPLVKDAEAADVYLKGQPKLGLWYPKESAFDQEAYSDSDYAGENLDRKSITRGCQFLGRRLISWRLISWQCKKQTTVATSTTEAEYVVVAHCPTLVKGRLLKVDTVKKRLLLPSIGAAKASSTNYVNTASTPVNTASTPVNIAGTLRNIPSLEDIYEVPNDGIFTSASYDAEGAVADFINLDSTMTEELPQFKTQQVWILVDLPFGKKKSWCDEFEALMKSRFQMSSMGELTFFLGLQVKQKEDGIFISQDKYVAEILKKFDFISVKTASTPIKTKKPLVKDAEAADVYVHLYRSMISSLMYLTASRRACSRF
nr:ribonuclease H-like domain, reverse transcriptase, RNA-dependent DNA polymerase [Tanacetum cinerariifolium]